MTLTPTQARCLKAMCKSGSVLHGPCGLWSSITLLSLILQDLARVTDRAGEHEVIEPTEAGRAEARRLEAVPYPEFCRHREKCAGHANCQAAFCCAD